jgi:hypothetical protein
MMKKRKYRPASRPGAAAAAISAITVDAPGTRDNSDRAVVTANDLAAIAFNNARTAMRVRD